MTLILKSNQTFTGAAVPIDAIEYEDRVLADGGVINDREGMLATFDWMRDNGISSDNAYSVTSARWGVKKHPDGSVDRLYNLFNPDGDLVMPQSNSHLLSGTGSNTRLIDNNTTSESAQTVAATPDSTLATMSVVFSGGLGRARHVGEFTKAGPPASSNGRALLLQADDPGYSAFVNQSGVSLSTFTPYAANESVVIRDSGAELQGIVDGAVVSSVAKAATAYPSPCKFFLNSNTGGNKVYGTFAEQWLLQGLTEAQALALSTRIDSLY